MSDSKPKADSRFAADSTASVKKASRLNLVWLVPFLALIVTAVLLWNNTLNRGPNIEVAISSAEGIEAGKTLVKLRSVTVGHVTDVRLDDSYSKALVKIQMEADTEDLLRRDTQFWLVKPRVENTGISGLDTLLSGSYFEMLLGSSEEHSSSFTALDEPPALASGSQGLTIKLTSTAQKRLSTGDYVKYRGFNAGRVISAKLNLDENCAEYEIFVSDPYTELLNANTKFWIASGIDISLTTEGLKVNTDSLDSVISGGVAFDNVNDDFSTEPFDAALPHPLFKNRPEAKLDALKSGLLYVVMLKDSLKNISVGSSVMYQNIKIGEVIAAPWFEDSSALFAEEADIPVLISLNFKNGERELVQDLFAKKLADHQLCAQADAANILTGDNRLALSLNTEECSFEPGVYRSLPVIPTSATVSIQDKLSAAADNLQALDVKGISDELKNALAATTEAMQAFTRSNDSVERTQLLEKMTESFDKFTAATASYAQGSEIYGQLQQTLNDLRMIIRDLDPAVTELGQSPSSLIFGSDVGDIEPRARGSN